MCAGAAVNARIERVVWGVSDLRAGAFGSVLNLSDLPLNHRPLTLGGVLAEECKALLTDYFKAKRKLQKEEKQKGQNPSTETEGA